MCPDNIQNDSYFRCELKEYHCLLLSSIMKCNRIKKIDKSEDFVKGAINKSNVVCIDERGKGIIYRNDGFLKELLGVEPNYEKLQSEYLEQQQKYKEEYKQKDNRRKKFNVLFRGKWQCETELRDYFKNLLKVTQIGDNIENRSIAHGMVA